MLIGFGPVVYFTAITGIIICMTFIPVCIIIMLFFGTPTSISFKFTTSSLGDNPILKNQYILLLNVIVMI